LAAGPAARILGDAPPSPQILGAWTALARKEEGRRRRIPVAPLGEEESRRLPWRGGGPRVRGDGWRMWDCAVEGLRPRVRGDGGTRTWMRRPTGIPWPAADAAMQGSGSHRDGEVGVGVGDRAGRRAGRGRFYMYTITKDGPDVHTTKKFGDTSISSRFFVLTFVPLWMDGRVTDANRAAKGP